MRMLPQTIQFRSPGQIYEFPTRFRSNFRWKNFSQIFVSAKKKSRQISGGSTFGSLFNIWLHVLVETPEKRSLVYQKTKKDATVKMKKVVAEYNCRLKSIFVHSDTFFIWLSIISHSETTKYQHWLRFQYHWYFPGH